MLELRGLDSLYIISLEIIDTDVLKKNLLLVII